MTQAKRGLIRESCDVPQMCNLGATPTRDRYVDKASMSIVSEIFSWPIIIIIVVELNPFL